MLEMDARAFVLKAINEYDEIGHTKFIDRYPRRDDASYGRSTTRPLVHEGREYPNKAIRKAAWVLAEGHPCRELLEVKATAQLTLMSLGFVIKGRNEDGHDGEYPVEDGPATEREQIYLAETLAKASMSELQKEFSELPNRKEKVVNSFERSAIVRAICIKRAEGRCEYCNGTSFLKSNRNQYFEVHHLQCLSENGLDHPDNCIALCANCHREVHYGANAVKISKEMKAKVKAKQKILQS